MKNALLVLTAFPATVYAFEPEATLVDVLVSWAPVLLLICVLWLLVRRIFGKNKRA